MSSLDTNVLLRFAMKDEPQHFVRARALLGQAGAVHMVADAVWVELAFALEYHYHLDRGAVADVVTTLLGIPSLHTNRAVIEATCLVFVGHPKLSFADCYVASFASQSGAAPLYTFDEKLARQHADAVLVPFV